MKKIVFVALTTLLFTLMSIVVLADVKPSEIYIHYYRYDDNYEGWNIWVWQSLPSSLEGQAYSLAKDDTATIINYGGAVTKITLNDTLSDATRLGFIVRKGNWDQKDIDSDRFIEIPLTTPSSDMHIYLVEGDVKIGYAIDDPAGPSKDPKFKQAYFKSLNTIYFESTEAIAETKIRVLSDSIPVSIESVDITGNKGVITLSSEVDFSKEYMIEGLFSNDFLNQSSVSYDGIYDTEAFNSAFAYQGDDLGATIKDGKTIFRLWAPISDSVTLNLYDSGTPAYYSGGTDIPVSTHAMNLDVNGTFYLEINQSLHGYYYTYSVKNGSKTNEVIDPYAKSSGINGIRGLIVDFALVNPLDFTYDTRADNMESNVDAIIYELHVRDLTTHSSWNGSEENRGKYLGLIETGTTYQGVTTGFDHIKELGITHVQLLPFFDYGVVDESKLDIATYNAFNWGYMPLNFNVLEGTYSSDPYDGLKRIEEMKQVVTAYTKNDIRLNMDVVYNHTGLSADSNFDLIVPGYYYRKTETGAFSNGSGTGNETASERSMMRKFMIDSTLFWATEYNISGFRFDLMALHDIETMELLAEELHKIDTSIMVYGEPWMGGTSPLAENMRADKANLDQIDQVGAFNDDFRDAVKGSVFGSGLPGFIQGDFTSTNIARIRYGIAGGTAHPDVVASSLTAKKIWHTSPNKTINYVTAHDNNTLYDKLYLTLEEKNQLDRIPSMQKQAASMVLLSQGVSFLHAGDEFLRSKPSANGKGFDHNSYESPDSVNQLRWDLKANPLETEIFKYYKGLISFRKNHPSLRMSESTDILANLNFMYKDIEGIISYELTNTKSNDDYERMLIIFNANAKKTKLKLPSDGGWQLVINQDQSEDKIIETFLGGSKISMPAHATYVLYQDQSVKDYNPTLNIVLITTGSIVAVAGIGFGVIFYLKKKKSL